jgi:hypothetical protein
MFQSTHKYTKAVELQRPCFWTGERAEYYYIAVRPDILAKCPGLGALSSKASVPAWPYLPFGMKKIAAFEAAVEWKAAHINDKEVSLPDDNLTKEMIRFINGEK